MAPNGDFDTLDESDETVMNSFLLSNIAPQLPGFNVGMRLKENLESFALLFKITS